MERIRLGVNVDHVASVRQSRGTKYPDPVFAAFLAEQGGADQITVHLREDRRHIQERDLEILRRTVATALNLEMAVAEEILDIACRVKPDMVTLVPEKRQELTTERGLGTAEEGVLAPAVARIKDGGIKISLFIDPEPEAVRSAHRLEVDQVEIHTGFFADAPEDRRAAELERIKAACSEGGSLGLAVAAGHGLDYVNTRAICHLPEVEELNIGHSIIARALFVGMESAVRELVNLMAEGFAER
ncbi:MAG: pyridoxine 5'-phosphate synthase [Deltaproteobacteria bacterium]|nr:pyridoxine 5'-phosphate synthase [Deltaproteobacteria bacterium]